MLLFCYVGQLMGLCASSPVAPEASSQAKSSPGDQANISPHKQELLSLIASLGPEKTARMRKKVANLIDRAETSVQVRCFEKQFFKNAGPKTSSFSET